MQIVYIVWKWKIVQWKVIINNQWMLQHLKNTMSIRIHACSSQTTFSHNRTFHQTIGYFFPLFLDHDFQLRSDEWEFATLVNLSNFFYFQVWRSKYAQFDSSGASGANLKFSLKPKLFQFSTLFWYKKGF